MANEMGMPMQSEPVECKYAQPAVEQVDGILRYVTRGNGMQLVLVILPPKAAAIYCALSMVLYNTCTLLT